MRILYLIMLMCLSVLFNSCSDSKQTERIFSHFLNRHVKSVKQISKKYNEAVWATYSGKSSFSELLRETRQSDSLLRSAGKPAEYYQNLLNNVYDSSTDFEILMKIKKSGLISDSLLKRQFLKVFRQYISIQNNWNESENRKTKLFEQFFELKKNESAYWDSISNIEVKNPVNEWIDKFAHLAEDYRSMIKAMNNDAKKLGYENYYQLLMDFNGIDYSKLDEIVAIVELETNNDYSDLLKLCQEDIKEEFDVSVEDMKPKHYGYTVSKMMKPSSWKKEYSQEQVFDICNNFFAMGDYQIGSILENSEIWYKSDKLNQSFFFCSDIEDNDFRIYANIHPSTFGVYTLFHELGHAVHFKYVDKKVPYLLKEPHTIATEAVAIYFSDKLYHSAVLRDMMELSEPDESKYYKAFSDPSRLIFLRKLIRTIEFEKSIFENPDQDFNEVWWSLTQKYLLYNTKVKDQLPQWMSNQHIIKATGIHVFYLYAFAVSSQLEAYFPDDIIGPLRGFMKEGNSMPWNEILERTTGEELNFKYLFNSYKNLKEDRGAISFYLDEYSSLSIAEEKFEAKMLNMEIQSFY